MEFKFFRYVRLFHPHLSAPQKQDVRWLSTSEDRTTFDCIQMVQDQIPFNNRHHHETRSIYQRLLENGMLTVGSPFLPLESVVMVVDCKLVETGERQLYETLLFEPRERVIGFLNHDTFSRTAVSMSHVIDSLIHAVRNLHDYGFVHLNIDLSCFVLVPSSSEEEAEVQAKFWYPGRCDCIHQKVMKSDYTARINDMLFCPPWTFFAMGGTKALDIHAANVCGLMLMLYDPNSLPDPERMLNGKASSLRREGESPESIALSIFDMLAKVALDLANNKKQLYLGCSVVQRSIFAYFLGEEGCNRLLAQLQSDN